MYCYTITIDEQGLEEVLEDIEIRINAFTRKGKPFRVITKEERPFDGMPIEITRFYLCLNGDISVKNDRQAIALYSAMIEAIEEVNRLNDANYIVVKSQKRTMHGKT